MHLMQFLLVMRLISFISSREIRLEIVSKGNFRLNSSRGPGLRIRVFWSEPVITSGLFRYEHLDLKVYPQKISYFFSGPAFTPLALSCRATTIDNFFLRLSKIPLLSNSLIKYYYLKYIAF